MSEFDGVFEWLAYASDTWWGDIAQVFLVLALVGKIYRTILLREPYAKHETLSKRLSTEDVLRENHYVLASIHRILNTILFILTCFGVVGIYLLVS